MSETTGRKEPRPPGGGPLPALVELALLVKTTVGGVAERYDLTPAQSRLLYVLAAEGPLRMADLGRHLAVEKAALTGLVDRAERRALVERRAVPGDRRSVHVALTDVGAAAFAVFRTEVTVALDALLGGLGDDERAAFQRMAETVVANGTACPAG